MRLLKRFKSVMFVWLLSYIVMCILPLVVGVVIYYYASSIVKGEIMRANSVIMRQTQQNTEAILSEVNSLVSQVSINPRADVVAKTTFPLTNLDTYYQYEFSQDLKVYNAGLRYVSDFYIYLKKSNMVLSPYVNMDAAEFFNSSVPQGIWSLKSWRDALLESGHVRYMPMERFDRTGQKISSIVQLQPVPVYQSLNYDAAIAVYIDQDKLMQIVKNESLYENGGFAILDKEGNLLSSIGTVPDLSKIKLGKSGEIESRWYDKDYFLIDTYSKVSGWQYVAIMKSNLFWAKMRALRSFAFAAIVFYFIGAYFVISFFLKVNYTPVRNLMVLFERKEEKENPAAKNEFAFIHQEISKTISANRQISEVLEHQKKSLFIGFMIRMLKGECHDVLNDQKAIELFDSHFPSDHFAVVAFYIEDLSRLFMEEKMDENRKLHAAWFIVTNVIEELVNRNHIGFMLNVDNMLICIINIREEKLKEFSADLEHVIDTSACFINQHFSFKYNAAISNIHDSLEGIQLAYKEAMNVMEYKVIFQNEHLMHYSQMGNIPKTSYYHYPLELEIKLVNTIKAGNAEIAVEILNKIFDMNFEGHVFSIHLARCFMFDLISTMLKTMQEIFQDQQDDFQSQFESIETLVACESVEEIRQSIIRLLRKVCLYVNSRRESYLKTTVVDFVKSNYKDPGLSVNAIADHLKMNHAYLSTAFKEQSGEGLLDFIMKFRVQQAKKLLADTDMTVEDIAIEVGYNVTRTFTRVFKKHEGVTPSEYRQVKQ